jgi:hypothetical protein
MTPSPTPRLPRARAAELLPALLLACQPAASTPPNHDHADEREPPAIVDHGPPQPYWGSWIGPELRLSFVGPWVLIAPREAGPGQRPIELRAAVVRREGDAFALQTSVAERYAADFVRPSDWTMLVEAGELALAMGDEPLETYVASDDPLLIGPIMLDSIDIPETIAAEDTLACLEVASVKCRELEADGPWAAGCREAQWGVCVAHLDRGQADPTLRAANASARAIHASSVALRFAEATLAAAPPALRSEAAALHARALDHGTEVIEALRRDGPLPADPHLPELLAALRAGGRLE